MQFIEKNSYDVRSAVYKLGKQSTGLQFLLLPMIHAGSKEYYEQVRARLVECDSILAEGVNSRKARFLTYSYRVVRRIKRMDLVTQQEALVLTALKGKILNADMNVATFDKGWSRLPFTLRALLLVTVPVYVGYLLLFGTRAIVAEQMATDDLPSRDEVLNDDEYFEKLDALIVDERDKVLLNHITGLDEAASKEKQLVAVLFGAQHMRSVSALLRHRLGYRIVHSEWITVFEL